MAKATKQDKQITSEQALQKPGIAPQISPSTSTGSQSGVTRAPEQTDAQLIVNNIVMRSVDRTPKDIGNLNVDLQAAESIYYPNRSRLYDLYKHVERDGHLSGVISKLIDSVLNKKMRAVKGNEDAEDICALIETIKFRNMCKEILLTEFWSSTGFEFIPGEKFDWKPIPRKHIKPEWKIIAINQTDYTGIPYENISNIWVIGEERDLGLYLKCAYYALLKKGAFSDWANYIEIFGQPLIVFKYDTYDEKTKLQVTKMIDEIGASLRIGMPKQADFDVMDGKTSNGNGDLQKQFVDACNDEMSVIVLGNTETTKSSKSSGFAQSATHSQQQNEKVKSLLILLQYYLSSDKFLSILNSYGYNTDGVKFISDEEIDENALLIKSQVDEGLEGMGVPLDDDYFYEAYNRPKPQKYDELKAKMLEKNQPPMPVDPTEPIDPTQPAKPTKPIPGKKPVQPVKPKGAPIQNNLSAWYKFRNALADFFAPAQSK